MNFSIRPGAHEIAIDRQTCDLMMRLADGTFYRRFNGRWYAGPSHIRMTHRWEGAAWVEMWKALLFNDRTSEFVYDNPEDNCEGFYDGLNGLPMQWCAKGCKYARDYHKGERAAIAKALGSPQ